ncbi:hypothetical protein ACFVRR_22640 [Gottfriedia sp. NPDC057948]|uniref:hypothetical protein n=1 Tax=Gottfriedia sp. NPDC057948 TaxID=3346287 RepID=UPI0036D98B7F
MIVLKFSRIFFCLITIILFTVIGCSKEVETEKQKILIQKHINHKYENYSEVTKDKDVLKAQEIFRNSDWKVIDVKMSRQHEYKLVFQFKNPDIQVKQILYRVWVNSSDNKLEITKSGRYVQLSKEDSATLYVIITGEKLANN